MNKLGANYLLPAAEVAEEVGKGENGNVGSSQPRCQDRLQKNSLHNPESKSMMLVE